MNGPVKIRLKIVANSPSGPAARPRHRGLDAEVIQRLRTSGLAGEQVQMPEATPVLGQSTYRAFLDAEA